MSRSDANGTKAPISQRLKKFLARLNNAQPPTVDHRNSQAYLHARAESDTFGRQGGFGGGSQ